MDYNKIEAKNNMNISNNSVEEKKVDRRKHDPIVTKAPKKVKKNLLERLVVGIIGPDGLPAIGSYLVKDVIGPALLQMTVESLKTGIDMVAYRGNQPPVGRSPYTSYPSSVAHRPATNYGNRYIPAGQTAQAPAPAATTRMRVEQYTIEDRNEAWGIVEALAAAANAYNVVALSEYYELMGVATSYTHHNYGWDAEDISKVQVQPVAGGFTLKFPPVRPL